MPAHPATTQPPDTRRGAYGTSMPSLETATENPENPGIDPILLKVLDAVPFRLSIDDGVAAARQRLRDLPRRPMHPELRVEDRAIAGPRGPLGLRVYWRSPSPPAVEDAWAATLWVAEHGTELGADTTRIAVAGDSAGGTIAAATAQRV